MNKKTQVSAALPGDELRLRIADLAIELHHARNAAATAKRAYYTVLHELSDGEKSLHLDPRDPECEYLIEHSKDEYGAYRAARRKTYNLQRRLDSACRKVTA